MSRFFLQSPGFLFQVIMLGQLMEFCANFVAYGQEQKLQISSSVTSLTLEQAMQTAENQNLNSKIAKSNRGVSEARLGQARSSALPRIDFDAQKIWFNSDTNSLTGKSPQYPQKVTTAGIQLVQPIIGLAPLLLQIQAATLNAETSVNEETTTLRDVRILGAQAYLNTQKAKQLISVAEASNIVADNQLKESQAMVRAGKMSQADTLKFELALTETKQQLSVARYTHQIALAVLGETLNLSYAQIELETPTESRFEKAKFKFLDLDQSLLQATQGRTEVRNAASNIKIAEYYKLAGDLDYLPSLNFFTRYERDFEAKDVTFPATGPTAQAFAKKDVQNKLSAGLQLKWNLWDWNSRGYKSEEYVSLLQKAKIGKEAAESNIRLEVTKSYLALKGFVDSLETAKTSVRLAEDLFRITKVKFNNGQATSTDVIASEREQTRARGGLVNIRADLDLAWLQYQKATGTTPNSQGN